MRSLRLVRLTLSLSLLGLAASLGAQPVSATPPRGATSIELRFPNAVHHEAEVHLRFSAVPAGDLELRMARSSPGRYAVHDFAKNVYDLRIFDAGGAPLPFRRLAPNVWLVDGAHGGVVDVFYTLFADRAEGTYAGIDETKIHLNIPATLLYAPALADRPSYVTFVPPDPSWRIATQLQPTSAAQTFRAPNLQYLMDSPTHLGALDVREWTIGTGPRQQTIRFAINHEGSAREVTDFVERTKRVVDEMAAVFGEQPRFDFGSYTFIACYRSTCARDGMEHRNSTSLTSSGSLAASASQLLGTVSHEYFHAWNVERIRPASLEPFNFADANMSSELWFAEGFTNYYGRLVLRRAGLTPEAEYARLLGAAVNTVASSPARRFDPAVRAERGLAPATPPGAPLDLGPVAMSRRAPFLDAATSVDPTSFANTFISYYTYGEAIALALDLTLRSRTPARTLDDLMRLMWERFGRAQTDALAPARTYSVRDVEQALAEVSGDPAYARDFFRRYIEGSQLPDFTALLDHAGIVVRQAEPNDAWMGDARLGSVGDTVTVGGPSIVGTPMYRAGLESGDRLLSLDGQRLRSPADVASLLSRKRPGDRVRVTWIGRAGPRTGEITLAANPRLETLRYEDAGRRPSAAQLAFRAAWQDSRRR